MQTLYNSIKDSHKKSVDELQRIVDFHMKWEIDGSKFRDEQAFEDDIRAMLKHEGFEILEKHNVENSLELIDERSYSGRIEDKIPDIVIDCFEGPVFLELKFCRQPAVYLADQEKCAKYLQAGKCIAAGVLFLDEKHRERWTRCNANPDYWYLWNLTKRK